MNFIIISDGALNDPYQGGDINQILDASDSILREEFIFSQLKRIFMINKLI